MKPKRLTANPGIPLVWMLLILLCVQTASADPPVATSTSYRLFRDIEAGAGKIASASYVMTGIAGEASVSDHATSAGYILRPGYSFLYAPDPLAGPSGLSATSVSQTRIDLAWTDNSTNETGFKIFRDGVLIATAAANAKSYSDAGLTCGMTYSYEVKAANASGDSDPAAINAATQACGGTPAGLPAAPSGLTAQPVSHEAIYLTWTDNSNNETGFIIERWSMGAAWTTAAVVGANVTSYTDSPLSYSWEYHYRIRAYNADGNSDYSNETSAITWFHPYETCNGLTLNGSEAVRGSASVQENAPAGTVIGTLGTIEPTGSHRYELFPEPVPGIDSRYFVIDGNMLKLGGAVKPDYEEKKELRVSLLSIDTATPYAWCHAEFVIAVTDVPEAPTFLHLSNYDGSVPENQARFLCGRYCDGRRPRRQAYLQPDFRRRGYGQCPVCNLREYARNRSRN